MKRLSLIVPIGLLAGSLLVYPLYAHCGKCAADGKTIAAQLDQNKFTLDKAIAAAEKHSKGRAISAISQLGDKDELVLNVFCMAGDKIVVCDVDPATGSVR